LAAAAPNCRGAAPNHRRLAKALGVESYELVVGGVVKVDERKRSAYHEAGHAVAAYYRGIPIEGVDIVPTEERKGVVKLSDFPANWDVGAYGEAMYARYFGQVIVNMAGVLAVEKLTGSPTGPLDPNRHLGVIGSDWWGLGHLSGQVRPDDLQRAYDEAKQVLRENWPAVEAVARALLEHGNLDKGALYAVLEKAGCSQDEEAVALVEEAYWEGEYERLAEKRWELYCRLMEGRNQGATEAETNEVYREFLRVDKELVEGWGIESWAAKRDKGNDAQRER